ncbi:hypothetical protein CEP54_008096 [Fusarium duplospermum]|uniref:Uncharacterized protein n=1 Tax=Fusarium duplospermum TaxID=1325734 RepID=A0A428PXR2_9HYPO|nr:hypothetical protein CEP54_008096 [Fusarium duplospermum]
MPVARPARSERSLLEDLEEEVALLESKLSEANDQNRAPEASTHQQSLVSKEHHTQSPEMIDLTILKEPETATLYRGELYGLREMTRRALELDNSSPRGLPRNSGNKGLVVSATRLGVRSSRPAVDEPDGEIMATYVNSFFSRVNASFSIVNEGQVWETLRLLSSNTWVYPEYLTQFYLILAIGAAMMPGFIFSHVHASSEYFLMATSQDYIYDDSRDTLLILLLLTLYSLLDPTTGNESAGPNPEPATIIQGMDDCKTMLQNLSTKWLAVTPHLLAFDRLSDKIKRLSEAPGPHVPPAAGNQMPGTISYLPSDAVPMDGQLTFWNVPLDVTGWDIELDGDIDMCAVFGNDFDAFHENNRGHTEGWQ